MRLGGLPGDSDATDVGAAMRAAGRFGQRPAIVVLRPGGRQEQGFGTLLQWAAKVSHWLREEHTLAAADRLGLIAPAGWLPAAAALGAWWTGVVVSVTPGDAELAVVHEHAPRPPGSGDVALVGDAFDGGPAEGANTVHEPARPLTRLVQLFPDQPPPDRARPAAPGLSTDGREVTQRELLEQARSWDVDGPLGLEADALGAPLWLPAVALRPLVTGRATVVLDQVSRASAGDENVAAWVEA